MDTGGVLDSVIVYSMKLQSEKETNSTPVIPFFCCDKEPMGWADLDAGVSADGPGLGMELYYVIGMYVLCIRSRCEGRGSGGWGAGLALRLADP